MTQTLKRNKLFIVVALLSTIIIFLSVDSIQVYSDYRRAKDAADKSALVALLAKNKGADYSSAALKQAAINGFNNDGVTNTVEVQSPLVAGPYFGAPGYLQVTITSKVDTKILHFKYENKASAIGYSAPCLHNSPDCSSHISIDSGGGPVIPAGMNKGEFANVDKLLRQSVGASLAYNKPDIMDLNETVTIEVLLNPSVPPSELGKQITESGAVTNATVDVTPRMEAYLYSNDALALIVQPLQESPEQLVGETSTARWSWSVKAVESGTHTLTLKMFQLVKYDGKENWQEVDAYKSDIQVKVSFGQILKSLDWKWVLPAVATAVLIPAFWRWYDGRKKNEKTQIEESKLEKQKQPARSKKSITKKKN